MDSLPKNLAEARYYLSKLKAWAVIATVAAIIVVGFYSLEGWRYWKAWDALRATNAEIERISAKLDRGVPLSQDTEGDLELQQQRLEYFQKMFNDSDSNRLIGIISNVSWETGVETPSISASETSSATVDSTQYQTQPITLTALGEIEDIYFFLSTLHHELPILEVTSMSIGNPGEEASAQIQLVFYQSPETTTEDEGAD